MLRKFWEKIRRKLAGQELVPSIAPASLAFEHGAATQIVGRDVNADHFTVHGEKRLYIVADGIGEKEGKVASRYVCRHVANNFDASDPTTLLTTVLEAHRQLRTIKKNKYRDKYGIPVGVPCTTLSALHSDKNGTGHLVHAGDSSIYRLRKKELERLTTPREPRFQGIGGLRRKEPPTETQVDVKHGDVFLLCTDGLTGNEPENGLGERQGLTDKEIKKVLLKTAKSNMTPLQAADHLTMFDLTRIRDSRTAIVVKVK